MLVLLWQNFLAGDSRRYDVMWVSCCNLQLCNVCVCFCCEYLLFSLHNPNLARDPFKFQCQYYIKVNICFLSLFVYCALCVCVRACMCVCVCLLLLFFCLLFLVTSKTMQVSVVVTGPQWQTHYWLLGDLITMRSFNLFMFVASIQLYNTSDTSFHSLGLYFL